MNIRTSLALTMAVLSTACVSGGAEKSAQLTATGGGSLDGMWCMQKPTEISGWYGKVSMIISSANDNGFRAMYIWDAPNPGSGQMTAIEKDGRFVMSGGVLSYSFEKNLDSRGRLVGTGKNSRDNNEWRAIFTRTSPQKGAVPLPDC